MIGPSGLLSQFQFNFIGRFPKGYVTKLRCEKYLQGHILSTTGDALKRKEVVVSEALWEVYLKGGGR
jgi:hypothetical protein